MKSSFYSSRFFALLGIVLLALAPAQAATQTQAGPYRVELETDPPMVPVGKAKLRLKVLDAQGKPVPNAKVRTLTRMPGMKMGEREETAMPQPDAPGQYSAPAAFPMGGGYVVDLKISAPGGEATGTIPLQTGQSTSGGGSGGFTASRWLLPIGLGLVVLFILWRMARTGQKFNPRVLLQWQAVAGIAVLLAMFFGARYAVNNLRRPGSLTPLEAQGMEMNMPAPEGTTAVELATVRLGAVHRTVRYTGQAVGYIEQDVYPRVTGNLLWMPLYAGDRVQRGQLIARLDRSQIEPQIAAQQAARTMAEQGANVARTEYEQALGAVRQAEAELSGKEGAVREAISNARKARAESGGKLGELQEAIAGERKAQSQVGNRRGRRSCGNGTSGARRFARSEDCVALSAVFAQRSAQ